MSLPSPESSNPGCKMNCSTDVLGQINDVTNITETMEETVGHLELHILS